MHVQLHVQEFGLSQLIGPVNVAILASGGEEQSLLQNQSSVSQLVDKEVKVYIVSLPLSLSQSEMKGGEGRQGEEGEEGEG